MDRSRRARLLAGLAALTSVLAGCQVDIDVGLDVAGDGSGQAQVAVVLDPEAARRFTNVADQFRIDDLLAAGWTVDGPERRPDDSLEITATKPFTSVAAAGRVLEEISGADGPLGGLRLDRSTSFLTTTLTLGGEVDLTGGLEGFSDDELRQRLAGSGFGLGVAELQQATGAPVGETFRLELRADLPGSVTAEEAVAEIDDAVVWRPVVGERTSVAATSKVLHTERVLWLVLAGAATLALVAVLGHNVLRRRRPAAGRLDAPAG